jgi:urocanate hydratase
LRRQVAAINKMAEAGTFFWDYGNAFLLESSRAGRCRVQSLEYRVQNTKYTSYLFWRNIHPILITGAGVHKPGAPPGVFLYPSYVQDIMG